MNFNHFLKFSLLQVASCIRIVDTEHGQPMTLLQSKRILYVKSIVRMLRLCGSKYQQLMATADGQISFNAAVHNLMTLINNNVTKGKFYSLSPIVHEEHDFTFDWLKLCSFVNRK